MQPAPIDLDTSGPAAPAQRPARALDALTRLRERVRRLFLADGVVAFGLAVLGVVIVSFVLDYALGLPRAVRAVLLIIFGGYLISVLVRRILRPAALRPSVEQLAILVERENPQLRDALVTAVQLTREDHAARPYLSSTLLAGVVRDVESRLNQISFDRVFRLKRLRRSFALLVTLLLLLGFGALGRADLTEIWLERNVLLGASRWPQSVELALLRPVDNPVTVALGDELAVEVGVRRGSPAEIELVYWTEWRDRRTEFIKPRPDGVFRHVFPEVNRPMTFRVRGGDDELEPVQVQVKLLPRVSRIALWCDYPAYTGREPTPAGEPIGNGHLRVPEGTRVRFRAASDVPLVRALVRFLDVETWRQERAARRDAAAIPPADARPLQLVSLADEPQFLPIDELESETVALVGTGFSGEFVVEDDGAYQFYLEGENGLFNRDPTTFSLRVIEDRAPSVRVLEPRRVSEEVSPEAEIPVRVRIGDDYGVREATLEGVVVASDQQAVEDGEPFSVRLEAFAAGSESEAVREAEEGELLFSVSEREIPAGARVHFYVRASDFGDNVGESERYVLHVVEKQEILRLVYDRLNLVREQLVRVSQQQSSARRDLASLRDELALRGAIRSEDARRFTRGRQDQGRVSQGIRRAAEGVEQALATMESNKVGDAQEKGWVERLAQDLEQLAGTESPAVESRLAELREAARTEEQDPGRLDEIIEEQRRIGRRIDSLALTLMEFGDFNGIIQRWRDILRREEEILETLQERVREDAQTR